MSANAADLIRLRASTFWWTDAWPLQCLDYTPILVPTAVLWLGTNFPPSVVCADLAMCEAMKALQSFLLQACVRVHSLLP